MKSIHTQADGLPTPAVLQTLAGIIEQVRSSRNKLMGKTLWTSFGSDDLSKAHLKLCDVLVLMDRAHKRFNVKTTTRTIKKTTKVTVRVKV